MFHLPAFQEKLGLYPFPGGLGRLSRPLVREYLLQDAAFRQFPVWHMSPDMVR